MTGLFSSIYLVSKIASAALNLLAVAVFTRLAAQEVYGAYLVAFAYSFIAYGLAVQWLPGAHFGQQTQERGEEVANAVIVLMAVSLVIGLALVGLAGWAKVLPLELAFQCALIMVSLSVYFVLHEIGRSRLQVLAVNVASVLRGLLVLVFGSLALWWYHTAGALVLAVCLAHFCATIPIFLALRRSIWRRGFAWPARKDCLALIRYGWPLMLAGGAAAAAANVDRLLLERALGAAQVAPYAVTLDFMKQSFTIVGESAALSYVSVAKAHHGSGEQAHAQAALNKAFLTTTLLGGFGFVFFILSGPGLLGMLFGDGYGGAISLLPILAIAGACLVVRNYYFAQVIYFGNSSRVELASTLVSLAASVLLSLWLIPIWGVAGAAAAFAAGQAIGLVVVLLSPDTIKQMPVDLSGLGKICLAGGATIAAGICLMRLLPADIASACNLLLVAGVAGTFLVRWDIFDAGAIWNRLFRRVRSLA